jgi:hypothetical protein
MKALLDDAIGAIPPSTIDVDLLVAQGRRQSRLRRLGLAGGLTGATATLGTALALALAAPLTVSTPHPAPTATSADRPVTEPVHSAEARLTAALAALVAERVPGVRTRTDATGRPALSVRRAYGGGQAGFAGSAALVTAAGRGNLWIGIGLHRIDWSVPTVCDPLLDPDDCAVDAGAAGERIVRLTNGTESHVYITRADGTGIIVIVEDEPIGFTEMIAIGTDPRWTLYP